MAMTTAELMGAAEYELQRTEQDINDGCPALIQWMRRAEIYKRFIAFTAADKSVIDAADRLVRWTAAELDEYEAEDHDDPDMLQRLEDVFLVADFLLRSGKEVSEDSSCGT